VYSYKEWLQKWLLLQTLQSGLRVYYCCYCYFHVLCDCKNGPSGIIGGGFHAKLHNQHFWSTEGTSIASILLLLFFYYRCYHDINDNKKIVMAIVKKVMTSHTLYRVFGLELIPVYRQSARR